MGLAHLYYSFFHLSSFNKSWITSGYCPAHRNTSSAKQDYTSYHLSLLYSLLNLGHLITYQSSISWPRSNIFMFSIQDFHEWVNEIFSLVTADYIIGDSGILEILPSSIHELPKFSLSAPLHVTSQNLLPRCSLSWCMQGYLHVKYIWYQYIYFSTMSAIKWWQRSICFVIIPTCLLFAIKLHLDYLYI